MRYISKITTVFCSAAIGLMALAGCEGSDIYNVNNPDWLQSKIDSVKAANSAGELVIPAGDEDVYTVGESDFSTIFNTVISKEYEIPEGGVWNGVFNLNVNPSATNTYQNFILYITGTGTHIPGNEAYWGAIRYDTQPTGNSEWDGTNGKIDRTSATKAGEAGVYSNLVFSTDEDEGINKLGGKIVLTVDRSKPDSFCVTMNNGTVKKTYVGLKSKDEKYYPTGTIHCYLTVRKSYINFLQTDIDPVGGRTTTTDKQPVSMVLANVPTTVNMGTTLEEAMKNVTATVTFEDNSTQSVVAKDLTFVATPDMETGGTKTLVAIYNKTYKGNKADTPISAQKQFTLNGEVTALRVVTAPTHSTYYTCTTDATTGISHPAFTFDPTGMVVYATYTGGKSATIDNSKLTFATVPGTQGTHTVTISLTAKTSITTTTNITVAESPQVTVYPQPTTLGATDNSSGFFAARLSSVIPVKGGNTAVAKFTNYSKGAENYQNWYVVLLTAAKAEYAVLRSDNYGWGDGYNADYAGRRDFDWNWATWLAAMNGAKCTMYVTNCNNGSADVQCIMVGTNGKTYYQHYLGVKTITVDDMNLDFVTDNCHYVFDTASSAKRYIRRR